MKLSASGSIELAKKHALPCPQTQPASFHSYHLGRSHQTRLDMGWRVSLQMAVRLLPRNDLVQDHEDVCLDARIGVLIDCHGCCGMWNKEEAESTVNALCLDHFFNLGSNVYEFSLGAGLDRQGLIQGASSEKKETLPLGKVSSSDILVVSQNQEVFPTHSQSA